MENMELLTEYNKMVTAIKNFLQRGINAESLKSVIDNAMNELTTEELRCLNG